MDKYIKYDAQPGVVLYIENKGSNRECCYDLDIKDNVTELYLMVFDFCLSNNKKQFKNISKIVILDTCGDLHLPNQMFPNVKEVVSCNSRRYFVKRNKLLFDEFNHSLINVFNQDYAFQVVYNAKINERKLIFCLASAMGDILLHRLDCAK